MRVNIKYPLGWLHDALIAAYPNVQWSVQGFDGEWAEVDADGGWPAGLNLTAFAATVHKPRRRLSDAERLTAGSGENVIGMPNAAVVPSTNPIGGVLYVQNGKLMYRGSNGTVTEIAPS